MNARKPLVGNRERYLCSRPFGLELRPFKPGAYGDPAPLAEYLPLLHRAYTGRPTCTLAVYRVDPSAGSSARPVAARADAADGSAKCHWSRNVATHRARHRPRRTASLLTPSPSITGSAAPQSTQSGEIDSGTIRTRLYIG